MMIAEGSAHGPWWGRVIMGEIESPDKDLDVNPEQAASPEPLPGPETETLWPADPDAVPECLDEAVPEPEQPEEPAEAEIEEIRPPSGDGLKPEEPGAAPLATAIDKLGVVLEQKIAAIHGLIEREIRAEATREKIVDRLHSELQEYKQDLLLKVQKPIFIDLIQLHDDIGKMCAAQPADDPERSASVRGMLDSIRSAIEDILYRQGVEPFQNEGDLFDARRQRAVMTVPIDEPERNKTIAGRLRPGFQAGEKLIRPEIVAVHTLRK
jgi:molecular chaperone GrpE